MIKFFYIVVRNQLNIYGGPKYGTKYILEKACDICGTGATPIGPLILKGIGNPKYRVFSTLDGEIILNQKISTTLKSIGIKCLEDILDFKTKKKLPFSTFRSEIVLPPFSEHTTGYEKEFQCQRCNRDGYFRIPKVELELKYDKIDPEILKKDILETFECFGNSKLRTPFTESVFANPLKILSERVVEVLKKENVKGTKFEQVSFLDK